MKNNVTLRINGLLRSLETDDDRTLLWVLRTELGLTGTKYGCGEGICGACTVLVNGRAVRACRTLLKAVADKDLTTIEGLAGTHAGADHLHPLQKAFMLHGAFQCGYCTPGMLMAAAAFLQDNPAPAREAIEAHMASHLCRCGAHQRIVDAIVAASQDMGEVK